jgi:Plant transposon protein
LFKQLFVLADGIYPDMSRLVKTLGAPIGKEQTRYAAWQESARKDIERAFGILQRKFNYHVWPFKQLELEDIKDIVFMCIPDAQLDGDGAGGKNQMQRTRNR